MSFYSVSDGSVLVAVQGLVRVLAKLSLESGSTRSSCTFGKAGLSEVIAALVQVTQPDCYTEIKIAGI
jgi:hypothetical protein